MSSTAAAQRRALARALREVEPDAETLCEGWRARDLAEHIVIRDRKPEAMGPAKAPVVGSRVRRARDEVHNMSYTELIDTIEAGAPRFSPTRLRAVDNAFNTAEFYIHTEDVLRAQPDWTPESSRTLSTELQRSLWKQASRTFFLLAARKHRWRLTYLSLGFGAVTHGRASNPLRVIRGAPEELLIWASGREEHATVELIDPAGSFTPGHQAPENQTPDDES